MAKERYPKIAVRAAERPVTKSSLTSHLEVGSQDSETAFLPTLVGALLEEGSLLASQLNPSMTPAADADGEDRAPGKDAENPASPGTESSSEIEEVRSRMSLAMGADFSAVEFVVNSARAADIGANAFCEGETIHFASGQFNPDTTVGLALIGHELAHVVQQRTGRVSPTTTWQGLAINDDRELEEEAVRLGRAAALAYSATTAAAPATTKTAAEGKHNSAVRPVTQLDGDYGRFEEAIQFVIGPVGPLSHGNPHQYDGVVPPNCSLVLWDMHKAFRGGITELRPAADWAQSAIDRMRALVPELVEHRVMGSDLLRLVIDAMATIMNPMEGAPEGFELEGVFRAHVDAFLLDASARGVDAEDEDPQKEHYNALRATSIAAANILSETLHADVPQQILNAASPYHYRHYEDASGIATTRFNALKFMYEARWEARNRSSRRNKLNSARSVMEGLFSERRMRTALNAITSLDDAVVDEKVTLLREALTRWVLDRITAINAEAVLTVPIAEHGEAYVPRAPRTGTGSRRAPLTPIEYPPGTAVTVWEPRGDYTVQQARIDLGDNPHATLYGANIGPYNGPGKKYPIVYRGRAYEIIARDNPEARQYFGIKYLGNATLSNNAIRDLVASTDPVYFNETERHIVHAVTPHLLSEGNLSSINTYDLQDITISGRGEQDGRASMMVIGGKRMIEGLIAAGSTNPQLADTVTALDAVINLIRYFHQGNPSGEPTGHMGPNGEVQRRTDWDEGKAGRRLEMDKIHELVELLERPDVHIAMALAKLNDDIVGFLGAPYEHGGEATLYNRDLDEDLEPRLATEMTTHNLHEVIIGIAGHNRLGGSNFNNPLEYAIRANNRYPQRQMFLERGQPDYARLSMQVAYMGKIRLQNQRASRPYATLGRQSLNIQLSQKIADFNRHFTLEGAVAPNGTYFDMAAATTVLPAWTSEGSFTLTPAIANPANLIVRVENEREEFLGYCDFGPMLDPSVVDLDAPTPEVTPEPSTP